MNAAPATNVVKRFIVDSSLNIQLSRTYQTRVMRVYEIV